MYRNDKGDRAPTYNQTDDVRARTLADLQWAQATQRRLQVVLQQSESTVQKAKSLNVLE